MPLGIAMSDECVFEELGIEPAWHRLFHDDAFHAELCRRYNDRAETLIGRRIVPEHLVGERDPSQPSVKSLADIFEAKSEWREASWSWWLHRSASNEGELSSLLDRVERRLENLREFIFPPDWDRRKERLAAEGRSLVPYRGQRGPVTFAMSVFGAEDLVYLILDRPDLAARYRDLILKTILDRARIIDEESGPGSAADPGPRRGWSWADDNCALLSPEMYRFFGYPILKGVFERYAPDPGDTRYQHSDSAMGHLLPLLGTLRLTGVNLGPTLSVTEIRAHLSHAVIHGQLAPLAFSRNEEVRIVAETLRDFTQSRERRGVVFTTAGSVNPGTRLSSMLLIMAAIQEYCHD
jgi:uroporphyrinogen decarboxylase